MLTDAECKNATCPTGKGRARLACSGGLYLEISPAGSRRWFWKYRKDGKEGRMALGSYPEIGPKDARKARDAAKLQKSDGRDPVQVRKVEKLKATTPAGNTFKATALEWYAMKLDSWSSQAVRDWLQVNPQLQADAPLLPRRDGKSMTVSRLFPQAFAQMNVQRLAGTYRALMDSLRQMSPAGADAHIALLTPGPYIVR